jgi:1-acyl-sn-glycerol-3-phosphate acyltransferase
MRTGIALFKGGLFFLNCIWVIPVQSAVLLYTKKTFSYVFPRLYHRFICVIMRIKIDVVGTPVKNRQVLYMSNHLSYLDIPLLGSLVPASFVSRADVQHWPLIGYLGSLQQTVYIQRKRSAAGEHKNVLQTRIDQGDHLIIFPEGTSTDGREVSPFKSSLFSLAMGIDGLCVQPVTIKIISVDGKNPTEQSIRDLYAWHIDMDTPFFEHAKRFAKTRGAHIQVTFHDPLDPAGFENRKTLANMCHKEVKNGLG